MRPQPPRSQQVVDTRNYLAHPTPALQERAAEGAEMLFLSNRLALLLEAYLLAQLGLPKEQVGRLIEKRRTALLL